MAIPQGLARKRAKSDFMPFMMRPVHSTLSLSAITDRLTATVYSPTAVVVVMIIPRYSLKVLMSESSPFTVRLPKLMRFFITGSSRSPSSIRTSWKLLRAFSSPACTVLFCTLYSLVMLVPSANALLAFSCSRRTRSTLPAKVLMTLAASAPLSCISFSTGAICAMPPILLRASRNEMTAALTSVCISRVNSSTSICASRAYFAGSW